jgi:hypothetical protein
MVKDKDLTFDNIVFSKNMFGDGISAKVLFDSGVVMSIIDGKGAYSNPREAKFHSDDFSSFEVAVLDVEGNFITKEFAPDHHDDVLGWQSREDINELITKINK